MKVSDDIARGDVALGGGNRRDHEMRELLDAATVLVTATIACVRRREGEPALCCPKPAGDE